LSASQYENWYIGSGELVENPPKKRVTKRGQGERGEPRGGAEQMRCPGVQKLSKRSYPETRHASTNAKVFAQLTHLSKLEPLGALTNQVRKKLG